tara:strand:- start:622 stop:855 length:234 start_codon:yes stop_codon:yes gene_type:complete
MMHPFDEYDQELIAKAQKEIVEEQAAWSALSEAKKTRILAEREATAAKLFEGLDVTNQDDEDEDDEDDEDEEEVPNE